MSILQFLFGKNLDKNVSLKPGTFYLDLEKNELWFDDPSNVSTEHNKIIDTATLIYKIESSIQYPAADGSDNAGSEDDDLEFDDAVTGGASAVLGIGVLGTMVLGTS